MKDNNELGDFVDSHEQELRTLFTDLLEEDFFVKRLSEQQARVLGSYYLKSKTDFDIAQEEGLQVNEVIELQDLAVKELIYFSDLVGIEDCFNEEDLVGKLKKGNEKLMKYYKSFEEKHGKVLAVAIRDFTGIINGRANKKKLEEGMKIFNISESELRKLIKGANRLFFSGMK
mgnify:CR=1 FL=1